MGTRLRFENDEVKIWSCGSSRVAASPFHAHTRRYFWTCVDGGVGLQRFADGTYRERSNEVGETTWQEHSPEDVGIHDLENAGDSVLRFVTVELLTPWAQPPA